MKKTRLAGSAPRFAHLAQSLGRLAPKLGHLSLLALLLAPTGGWAFEPEAFYQKNCISCHGIQGHGDGHSGLNAENIPLGLSYQGNRELMLDTILSGKKAMPGWSDQLSREEADLILDYIATLGSNWATGH